MLLSRLGVSVVTETFPLYYGHIFHMPPICKFSVNSAGGHTAVFVIGRWQSLFYTPCDGRGGFKTKFKKTFMETG